MCRKLGALENTYIIQSAAPSTYESINNPNTSQPPSTPIQGQTYGYVSITSFTFSQCNKCISRIICMRIKLFLVYKSKPMLQLECQEIFFQLLQNPFFGSSICNAPLKTICEERQNHINDQQLPDNRFKSADAFNQITIGGLFPLVCPKLKILEALF